MVYCHADSIVCHYACLRLGSQKGETASVVYFWVGYSHCGTIKCSCANSGCCYCKYSGKYQACCSSSAAIFHWLYACADGKSAKKRIVVLDDNRPSFHYGSDEVLAFRLLARISRFHFCTYLMLGA